VRTKAKAKIRPTQTRKGAPRYQVDFGKVNGKRKILSFSNLEAAEAVSREFDATLEKSPALVADVLGVAKHEVLAAMQKLQPFGVSIGEVVDYWIRTARPVGGILTLKEGLERMQSAKEKAGRHYLSRSQLYYKSFLLEHGETVIPELTQSQFERFLAKQTQWGNQTVYNFLRFWSIVFNYFKRNKFSAHNPVATIERPKVNQGEVKPIPVDVIKNALSFAMEEKRCQPAAFIVLVGFCGIRTEEVAKMKWGNIDLEKKLAVVGATIAKKNKRRANDIPQNALEFLKLLKDGKNDSEPIIHDKEQKMKRFWAAFKESQQKKLPKGKKQQGESFDYQQNMLRHSFGSYGFAEWGMQIVCERLGHTDFKTFVGHYKGIASKEQAKAYFEIFPFGKKPKKPIYTESIIFDPLC